MCLSLISSIGNISSVIHVQKDQKKKSHCGLVQYTSNPLIPPLNTASNNRRKESADSPHLSQLVFPYARWYDYWHAVYQSNICLETPLKSKQCTIRSGLGFETRACKLELLPFTSRITTGGELVCILVIPASYHHL
jgi:hypothetical protein